MKTGDTIQDASGGSWQFGQLLGRGLWGKAFAVRRESDDVLFVLKCPLGPEDFRGEIPAADAFYATCREAVLEQARVYADARVPFLPRLETRLTLPNGSPAYILPKLPDSLERRLAEGMPMAGLLETLHTAIKQIRQLPEGCHGSIRPTNILFNDRGEMFLTDAVTPAVQHAVRRLLAVSPAFIPFYPPELTDEANGAWTGGVDAWSAAMTLWRGAMLGAPAPNPPRAGLDKSAQVALRDRLNDRLKQEDSNPRFHGRVAERTAVLLARALSREAAPSPPFRFPNSDEFGSRIDEIASLIRPQVSSVGKVLLDRPAARPNFDSSEPVAFSSTVACTQGVEGPEEIGVGIAVFDIDRDQRLKDLDLAYTVDKHPGAGAQGGRYRFAFKITGLGPGRFRARLAFAIRDSGQTPATTETEFLVTAAPGWVPAAEEPAVAPLAFPRDAETLVPVVTPPMAASSAAAPIRRIPVASPPRTGTSTVQPIAQRTLPVPEYTNPGAPIPGPAPTAPTQAPPAPFAATTRTAPVFVPLASPGPATPSASTSPVVTLSPRTLPVVAPVVEPDVAFDDPPELKPRPGWSDEPLPIGRAPALPEEDDEGDEEEPTGPSMWARVAFQLRNDPYIALMAGLGVIVLVLLIIFVATRTP